MTPKPPLPSHGNIGWVDYPILWFTGRLGLVEIPSQLLGLRKRLMVLANDAGMVHFEEPKNERELLLFSALFAVGMDLHDLRRDLGQLGGSLSHLHRVG